MYPHSHFIATLFLAEIFVRLGYISHRLAIVCAIVSVLVDFDHLIEYCIVYKRFSFKNAWNVCVANKLHGRTAVHRVFGIVVFALATLIISLFSLPWAIVIGLGYFSHLAVDLLYNVWIKKSEKMVKTKLLGFLFQIRYTEVTFDIIMLVVLYLVIYM
ncbi:hypothetical protein GF371_03465 [Candidatus Woesearchaeota archaeon]|nr:hypothetical protein [Candidatus Woesearchaeota archaeon]